MKRQGYQPQCREEKQMTNPPKGGSNIMPKKELFAEININFEVEDLSEECILAIKYSEPLAHNHICELSETVQNQLDKYNIKAPVFIVDDQIEFEAMSREELIRMKEQIEQVLGGG
ncbi:hypothetical protein MWH25_01405 [Natroniella acetigena]|uniref:hypothetical protein n=1 Tax=Natroniella acetigena TaxID=52004 RepID=UPI00200B4D11|nr:hypothetical protein [Natroniella acetigena]MCK8826404.1 hypothetical protein [Natroniella acetigena]